MVILPERQAQQSPVCGSLTPDRARLELVAKTKTVVVADDDPDIVRLLFEVLSRRGFKVVPTTSPIGIGALVRRNRPDVLILDVMMPGLDGESVARLIEDAGQRVPIVFYSAMDEGRLLELIGRVPRSTYVQKGTPIAEIADTVDRIGRMYGVSQTP